MKTINSYLIGIDGGGTKTNVFIENSDGSKKVQFKAGAFNINGQSESGIRNTLDSILCKLKENGYLLNDCSGIGIGAAGISNSKTTDFLNAYFKNAGVKCPVKYYGDNETALAATFSNAHGIILISGTGSICYGISENGNVARSGGYGHIIDDDGSAYYVGKSILSCAVRSFDGRIAHTPLEEDVFDFLKINSIEELVSFVYNKNTSKKDIASLSKLIEKRYDEKDEAATKIVDDCAEGLFLMLDAVLRKLNKETDIALGGSVLVHSDNIRGALIKKINSRYSGLNIVITNSDASKGAIRLLKKDL